MKIVVIDGQGGKMGKALIEQLKALLPEDTAELYAIGTNGNATAAMMKAGADFGATGENPITVACRDADVIVGPIGIVIADSFLGEVTPHIAVTIGQSRAAKFLLPMNRCHNRVIGVKEQPLNETVKQAATQICDYINGNC